MGVCIRTCVGCGAKRPQEGLIRLVAPKGRLELDGAKRAPGRGAYVCGEACIAKAIGRRAFGRAFRGQAEPPDARALSEALRLRMKGFDPGPRTD